MPGITEPTHNHPETEYFPFPVNTVVKLGNDGKLWIIREAEMISWTKLYSLELLAPIVQRGNYEYAKVLTTHSCWVPEFHIQDKIYKGFPEPDDEIRLVSLFGIWNRLHSSFHNLFNSKYL